MAAFVLLLCCPASNAAPPAVASASSDHRPNLATPAAEAEPDIVVEGRRKTDRYRIAPELRTLPAMPDRRASGIDPRLYCHGVGPIGCGTKPLPIVTIAGDGKARFGPPGAR